MREFISKMQRLFNIFLILLGMCFLIQSVEAKEMKFIQISNLQFGADEKSIENYSTAIKKINKTKNIDFVVFTGGNLAYSDEDLLKEFLKMSKKLKYPYYIQIGPSDCQKNQGITKETYINILNRYSKHHYKSFDYTVKKDDVILAFVDGSKQYIPTTGYYRTNTVTWLDKVLTKYENKNVLIFQYFPLYKSDLNINTHVYKPDIYFDVLKKHKNVLAIFSSSVDLKGYDVYNDDILYSTAPSAYSNTPTYKEIFLSDDNGTGYEIYTKNVEF